MVKDYYKILGLSHTATQSAIKSAYRELALRFHPDKNQAPEAHARFVEINEAYQVLSDQAKKDNYDYRYNKYIINKEPQPEETQSTYSYRPQPRTRPYYPPPPPVEDDHEGIQNFIKRTSWITLLLSVFLLVDFHLPRHINYESLASSNLHIKQQSRDATGKRKFTRLENYDIIRTENFFVFYKEPPLYMELGDPLVILSSRILDMPVEVYYDDEDELREVPTQFGLYDLHYIYYLMFLLSAFCIYAAFRKKTATEKLAFMWFVNAVITAWILISSLVYFSIR